MENTNARAVLTFGSDSGRNVRFSVPRAYPGITPAAAMAAMQAIVSTGAVLAANGTPTEPLGAMIVKTERTVLVGGDSA